MAELARPVSYGVNPTIFNPQPVPIGPFAVDQRKSAKAALLGTIAQALGELPGKLLAAYQEGQKARTGNLVRREYEQALAGQPTKSGAALSDFQGTSGGAVTLNAEDPALRAAKANYYNRPSPAEQKPALYNYLNHQFEGGTPGTPLGKVTDYGQPNDAFKDSNSLKAIGAWDNKLEAGVSLAVSPDVRAQFEASGIKPRDMVNLRTADGKTIQARWDDLTANDEEAKQIGLPPLRGRFDIYSPQGPHSLRDTGIVGFEKAGVPADRQAQIGTAATDVGMQLASVPPTALSASTAPGAITPAPVAPLANVPVRRPTLGRDPKTGAIIYAPTPTEVTAVFPTGDKINISPPLATAKEQEGRIFDTAKEAEDAGFSATDADVLPDGRIRVTKFKASGSDIKGRSKLVASQQKQIESASKLAQVIDSAMDEYDNLAKEGKAGVVGGRVEKMKGSIGIASEESSKAQAKLNRMLYGIARELNGAGVLTNQDLARAEASAPTITEGRAQFKGKLEAIKEDLRIGIKNSLVANAGKLSAEQIQMGEEALKSLGGDTKITPTAQPATTGMIRMLKPDGTPIRVPADKKDDALRLGATLVQ